MPRSDAVQPFLHDTAVGLMAGKDLAHDLHRRFDLGHHDPGGPGGPQAGAVLQIGRPCNDLEPGRGCVAATRWCGNSLAGAVIIPQVGVRRCRVEQ